MRSRRHFPHYPVAIVSTALVLVVAAACSGGSSVPPPSAAQALLKSCQDLMLAPDPSVTPPIEERRVMPRPPRSAGSSGYACIQGTVSEQGHLTAFKVLRTDNPAFVPACMEALQQWQYKPASRSGTPVAVDLVVSFSFARNQSHSFTLEPRRRLTRLAADFAALAAEAPVRRHYLTPSLHSTPTPREGS